jgi:hypothetical protein
LGERGDDALVLVRGHVGGDRVDAVVADAARDPLGVDVLVRVDADGAVQGDAVEDALEARRRPGALARLVALDELEGAERAVYLKSVFPIGELVSIWIICQTQGTSVALLTGSTRVMTEARQPPSYVNGIRMGWRLLVDPGRARRHYNVES